ncbi:hypothetical protein, partial [Bradyrhizobium sp.]|uniref:hypothetical protein n=1 Tax=Bradyrhizobium sp. TaxID=376 RepID=UPI0025BD3D16
MVVAPWEGDIDRVQAKRVRNGKVEVSTDDPRVTGGGDPARDRLVSDDHFGNAIGERSRKGAPPGAPTSASVAL